MADLAAKTLNNKILHILSKYYFESLHCCQKYLLNMSMTNKKEKITVWEANRNIFEKIIQQYKRNFVQNKMEKN